MKKLYLFFILVMLNSFQHLSAQNQKKMDSLQTRLNGAKDDTTRLRLYLALGNECDVKDNLKYAEPASKLVEIFLTQTTNIKQREILLKQKVINLGFFCAFYRNKSGASKFIEYNNMRTSIFKEIKDTLNFIQSILENGTYYYEFGNLPKALEYYQNGLSLSKNMVYKRGIAQSLEQLGMIYENQNDTAQALNNYKNALLIYFEMKDTNGMASLQYQIGNFYCYINMAKAMEYYNRAILLFKSNKNSGALAYIYFLIGRGYIYCEKPDLKKALENLQMNLSMSEELNSFMGVEGARRHIGIAYAKQGDIIKAINYHIKAIKVAEEHNVEYLIGENFQELGYIYLHQRDLKKAKDYSENFLVLAKREGYSILLQRAEYLATKVDSACGNGIGAFEHYKQYIIIRDKANSDEIKKAANQEKFKEEVDKQKAEQEKKDIIAAAENRKQKIITGSVIAGLVLVLVFAFFVLRSLSITRKQKQIIELKEQEAQQQKHVIEEKQLEIIDSITYAKRLQQAILPSLAAVKEQLPNSFVYYQPKDIVAGDFYWMHTTPLFGGRGVGGEVVFIAAADCTGHGVPGAMVSVVCSNALNRAVNEFNLIDTALILDKTRELVIETFEKSDAEVKDGMDISLMRIENLKDGKKQIQWSGANNSLWYILNNELIEVKADKQPIGKYSEAKPFTANNFTFNEPVTFYLFSDGYADQFSPDDKKLMKKKFKDIVLTIQNLSMEEQKNYLDKFHTEWKGVMEQTDDVLVIGIKI